MPGNPIKNFFTRKRNQAKFLTAGPGRKLNATEAEAAAAAAASKPRRPDDAYVPPNRSALTPEARAAADAALARVQRRADPSSFNTSIAAIRMQVKRELEAEKQAKLGDQQRAGGSGGSSGGSSTSAAAGAAAATASKENNKLAVQGVFFRCPMVSDEVLPRADWKDKIKSFLYEQLEGEQGLTACLIIQNCNTKDRAEQCIDTLAKYVGNIVTNPDEEKYRKIRLSNRHFAERVRGVEGGYEFLIGAGFAEQTIDGDVFLVHSGRDVDTLPELLDALRTADKISLELDRNIQVLLPSQARKFELPADFFRISPEEVKKEQRMRTEAMESAQVLKTKAMREKEELRTLNMYKFTLMRVRFPDGVFLQGTFSVYEKLGDVVDFVRSCLKDETFDFSLVIPAGPKLTAEEYERTLYDLRLVPSVLLTFVHDQPNEMGNYLKDELLMLIQDM